MKSSFAVLAIAALSASAAPAKRAVDDATILQFALTLEHLENAFYSGALAKFDANAFANAGYAPWVRARFEEIGKHEAAHVAFLSGALGGAATKPCAYNFPYNDPKSFVALSQALEGVGVSAYAGAAQYISNKDYLTAAAVVLSTEARHASWVASAVAKSNPWSSAFDTPLSLNNVYSLAANFITSCPSTNPTLPVKAFPALTVTPTSGAHLTAGASAKFAFANAPNGPTYAAYFNGLTTVFVEIKDGQAPIPSGLKGTIYAVVSTSNSKVDDSNTLAGPAILSFPFGAGK